jgi:hypothetical protein
MIKKTILIHSLVTLAIAVSFISLGQARHVSHVLAGSFLVIINFMIVMWSIKQILLKKSVALPTLVIVTKYAILIGLLIFVTSNKIEIGFPFAVGIGSIFPSLIYFGWNYMKGHKTDVTL